MPAWIPAAISAGASILQGILGNRQIEKTNVQNKQFAMDMYNMNRRDALADWQRQVDYQSPEQQMARFKAAGLSPHLIYGQMQNAPTVRTPEAPKFEAMPKQGLPTGEAANNAINNYFASQIRQADIDLAKQRIEAQALLNEKTKAETTKLLQDTDFNKQMFPYTLGGHIQRSRNLSTQGRLMEREYVEKVLKFPTTLEQLMQNVAKTKEQILNIKADRAKTYTDISRINVQKSYVNKQIHMLQKQLNWYDLTTGQKYATGKILQESAVIKNLLMGKQGQGIDLDNDLKRIKSRFKDLGLSESVTSDVIKTIMQLLD